MKEHLCKYAIFFLLGLSACASHQSKTLYEQWGQNLATVSGVIRKADVSMMLGQPPSMCEKVGEVLRLGVYFDSTDMGTKTPKILFIVPDSGAEKAGLRAGDIISYIGQKKVKSSQECVSEIRAQIQADKPMAITTQRGTVSVVPRKVKEEQCYWNVGAGQVGRSGGGAYVNQYGGSGGYRSSVHQRFFRASCRVEDGFVVGCRAHWQE